MSAPKNPPAFPTLSNEYGCSTSTDGLSLRDYFMAHSPVTIQDALIVAGGWTDKIGTLSPARRVEAFRVLAMLRGEYADAMLEEREKP